MKVFSPFVLAGLIFLTSTSIAFAQGGELGIVQEAIMAALRGAGAEIESQELYTPKGKQTVCRITYRITDPRGMRGIKLLEEITGYRESQLWNNGVSGMIRNADVYTFSFDLPPEFCNDPGKSVATNPAPQLDDDAENFLRNLKFAAVLVGLIGIFWGIPRLMPERVRIDT